MGVEFDGGLLNDCGRYGEDETRTGNGAQDTQNRACQDTDSSRIYSVHLNCL
jgi:hypothetical protein